MFPPIFSPQYDQHAVQQTCATSDLSYPPPVYQINPHSMDMACFIHFHYLFMCFRSSLMYLADHSKSLPSLPMHEHSNKATHTVSDARPPHNLPTMGFTTTVHKVHMLIPPHIPRNHLLVNWHWSPCITKFQELHDTEDARKSKIKHHLGAQSHEQAQQSPRSLVTTMTVVAVHKEDWEGCLGSKGGILLWGTNRELVG